MSQQGGGNAVPVITRDEHEYTLQAKRVVDIPDTAVLRMAYHITHTEEVEYLGFAPRGTATDAEIWFVYKFTFDASARVTIRQSASGAWDDRTILSYS